MAKKLETTVLKSFLRPCLVPALCVALLAGCSSYQPTKDAWKGTKNFWNAHVSPAAEIDYGEKGSLAKHAQELTNSMMEIDRQLSRLERVMTNADKPPTKAWVSNFMTSFPWLNGFAGVKYDGTILGRAPETPLKEADFIPLLYEDKNQSNRALRADVQNTPLGPEIVLAVPLYDSSDFLGIVAAHFDMRTLVQFADNPSNLVILSPQALLWPGKYDYAATPLAGVNWAETVSKNSSGWCKNPAGSFYYVVRYFANLPLIFAVADSGSFPEGDGNLEQSAQYFPKANEKLPPPPRPERKSKKDVESGRQLTQPGATKEENGAAHDIQPGSSESVLLKEEKAPPKTRVQEARLEGEDIPAERVRRPRTASRSKGRQSSPPPEEAAPSSEPVSDESALPGGRPSPFGPREEVKPPAEPAEKEEASEPSTPTLPGGRPSPFGPRE
ncbi:MAG: hypothetical protein LBC94_01930 [Desulfovibrio sp.]|jgi:hypothetical protein|nr:hypothetical protein [Desulfovibrio sp.]